MASGANHTLALLDVESPEGKRRTELWGCGDSSLGQLGPVLQDTRALLLFQPINLPLHKSGLDNYSYKFVSASWETTYIVLSSEGRADILISMGADDFGDLGVGGTGKGKGKEPAPFHIVNFGNLTLEGTSIKKESTIIEGLVSGQHHVVVQLRGTLLDGTEITFLTGWGASRHGQLGNVVNHLGRAIPFLTAPVVILNKNSQEPIIAYALGSQHTVVLYGSGEVYGLGSNRKGQLQGLETTKHVAGLGCTWNGTYLLMADGQGNAHVMGTGSHMHGQLGRKFSIDSPNLASTQGLSAVEFPAEVQHVKSIACGTEHILAICSSQMDRNLNIEVCGWGWNEHGNLGTGSTNDVLLPTKIWADAKSVPIRVWAGPGTSWIYATQVERT